jgi:hypothetical protein
VAIRGPAAETAERLGVSRQAVEQVWKRGATVTLIKRWQSILRGEALSPNQIKSIARKLTSGWLDSCLQQGYQVEDEGAEMAGQPLSNSEAVLIYDEIRKIIKELSRG